MIKNSIVNNIENSSEDSIENCIESIVNNYRSKVSNKLNENQIEINSSSPKFMYELLGCSSDEFLNVKESNKTFSVMYSNFGHMIENAVIACLKLKHPSLIKHVTIKSTQNSTYEEYNVDCIIGKTAFEIKSRFSGATAKFAREKAKINLLVELGYTPVYLIFYESDCNQSSHESFKEYIRSVGGECYYEKEVFNFIKNDTNIDLESILTDINKKNNFKLFLKSSIIENN